MRGLVESVYGESTAEVPEGLKRWEKEAEAVRFSGQTMGTLNALNVENGYRRTPDAWLEDTVTPTRLGKQSITRASHVEPDTDGRW